MGVAFPLGGRGSGGGPDDGLGLVEFSPAFFVGFTVWVEVGFCWVVGVGLAVVVVVSVLNVCFGFDVTGMRGLLILLIV